MGCADGGMTWRGTGGAGEGRLEACFFCAKKSGVSKTPHFDWAAGQAAANGKRGGKESERVPLGVERRGVEAREVSSSLRFLRSGTSLSESESRYLVNMHAPPSARWQGNGESGDQQYAPHACSQPLPHAAPHCSSAPPSAAPSRGPAEP